MPTPGDIICGNVRLESLAPASLGAAVFQPVFVAHRDDADEAIWLTVVEGAFTPTPMNMSTFMAGANGMLGIRHPALVRVVLVDREVDYTVVGYEALPGAESMTDLVTRGGSRGLLGRTAIEIARGLAFLHRRKMLHGALTPSTVVLWEGMPVLWEYGIAALCAPTVFGPRARSLGGEVVAPEVPRGAPLTPATDVFAWGAVLASVATGFLGAEAVTAVLDSEVDEGRQGALFDLIRESLSGEANGRPRDGTHLLERLLSLDLDATASDDLPSSTSSDAAQARPDADLSDLARLYLDEMSAAESRAGGSAVPGSPLPVGESEASGSLGRLQLKKARFSTDSQKIVGFVDEQDISFVEADSAPIDVTPEPTPRPVATPPIPKPPAPGSQARRVAADGRAGGRPVEDSALHEVPLWKSASAAKSAHIAPPVPATPPPGPSEEASEGTSEKASEETAAGPPADSGPLAPLSVSGPEADAEAELRDAFRDLTEAADAEVRDRDDAPSSLGLADVPDDPGGDFAAAAESGSNGVPQRADADADVTPIPTRPPDPDVAPQTGGWIRPAERPDDPNEAVDTKLPPARDYGDGVHKRTFQAAPDASLDDETPREGLSVPPPPPPPATPSRGESGLAKLRKLWPRKAQTAATPPQPPVAQKSSRAQAPIAPDGSADVGPPPAYDAAPPAEVLEVESAPPPVQRDSADALPPAGPVLPRQPERARPVAPFVPPRSPGPHGPRATLMSRSLVVFLGGLAFVATLRAAQHRGGLDMLIAGAPVATDSDSDPVKAAATRPAEELACPEGSVALPSAEPPDRSTSFVCIERAEFPGAGEVPTTGVDLAQAEAMCEGRGRRLCSTEEWQLACRGLEERKFPYGPTRQRERCHASAKGALVESGSYPACVTPQGVVDLVGNAAEWVAEGVALGGSATTRSANCGTKLRPGKRAKRAGVGTRCCVDVVP